ncbi:MAG TPA: ATP-binding protein [Kofleriaceae bacterium]|nr:ATP-binding protein [Kofleriaceae bacterium]
MSRETAQGQLSDETLRMLLDIAPDAIAIVRGGTVLYMSPTGARMLGYASAADVIGINMDTWLHPDDLEVARVRIAEAMRNGRAREPSSYVYRSRRRDGSVFLAEVASVPITYEGGPALLAFVRDVTERKALESRLAEAERLAALGRLSAGVAHELNNPLTHLVLAVTRLRQLCDAFRPENAETVLAEARSKLSYMSDDLDRMMVIARELRLFSSPQPTSREPVALRDVLERALRIVEENDPAHGIRIERRQEEVPPADADASRLVQVFINLVRNAFDSLREAPGDGPPTVTLTLRPEGEDCVAAEVSDNGPGVAPELRERIFEPFFTTKPYGAGAGLGLAISRNLIQALDGRLEVSSEPGGGTTFTVVLPCWRRPAQPAERPRPAPVRLRVLVIDDEISIGRTIDSIFEDQHDVVVTTSARDALAQLEQGLSFDLILCDVVMPGASGVDFYEGLQQIRPDLCDRVVFMTGATLGSDAGRSLAALPNVVLEKPFDLDRLEAIIAAAAR